MFEMGTAAWAIARPRSPPAVVVHLALDAAERHRRAWVLSRPAREHYAHGRRAASIQGAQG
mgnify:CR=1 FL=1